MNWDNWYNEIYNNSFWNNGEAMGNWLNGRELIDNKVYNNYSDVGPWIGNDFKNNIIDAASPFENVEERNFIPRADGPLVDAGMVIPGTTGQVIGSFPDVGAYEFGLSPWRPGVNRITGGDTLVSLRVSILSPSDETVLTSPAVFTLQLEATSEEGVRYTGLYLDETLIGLDSIYPYEWNSLNYPELSGMSLGEHILTAIGTDINGISFSDRIKVLVLKITPGDSISLGHKIMEDGNPGIYPTNMIINESESYTNVSDSALYMRISEFGFYAMKDSDPITPFVVRVNGDNDFTTLCIGSTRDSTEYEPGYNSFRFRESQDTIITIQPGETIAAGFLDAYPDGSGGGSGPVIPYTETQPADEIWWTGNSEWYQSGKLLPGKAPVEGAISVTYYRRNYQFHIDMVITEDGTIGPNMLPGTENLRIRVYPNPVSDSPLVIEAVPGTTVSVFDLHGRKTCQEVMKTGTIKLGPEKFGPAGVYILRAQYGTMVRTIRINKL
jgi:hypothetical protein